MDKTLKLLLVEDSLDDEFLIRRELEQSGFHLELHRVTSASMMKDALIDRSWDLVISDYQLPGFSGRESLQIFRASGLEIPYIVLSGMIGEDLAVEMMRLGACDYLMKDALKRLPMAVERELRERASRQSKRQADEELRTLNRYYQILSQTNQAIVRILDPHELLEKVTHLGVDVGGFFGFSFWKWNDRTWTEEVSYGEIKGKWVLDQIALAEFPFTPVSQNIGLKDGRLVGTTLFPIRVQGRPWGSLVVGNRDETALSVSELQLLGALCEDLAFALEARSEALFRRDLDRQLARERERLALTLENVLDGIAAIDSEGKIAFLNHRAEVLLGIANGVGINLVELLPLNALELRQNVEVFSFVNKRGQAFSLELSASAVLDSQGSGLTQVILLRDITEREKVEERLRQSEKMDSIGLLAGGIAHDFNNLLTGIFGFLQLAKMNVHDSEKVELYLERTLNPFNRARNLTQQLLTFAKGGQPLKKRLKLGDLIKSITDFTLAGSAIVVDRQLANDLFDVQANEAQLGQVFENLILNSKQMMSENGRLTIKGVNKFDYERADLHLPLGNYVEITVSDTGPGIEPELISKIFDPFFTTRKDGTGLGLSICFSIIKKHSGVIEVQSVPGQGATFTIFLPSLPSETQKVVLPNTLASRGQGRVFFLDDEDYARSIAASMFEKLGYQFEVFEKGVDLELAYKEALETGNPVDWVILDLTIRGGPGGLEVLKNLQKIDPRVIAVASSGYSDELALSQPNVFGFAASLPKPFTMDELRDVLEVAMQRSHR